MKFLPTLLAALLVLTHHAAANDWGLYSIHPVGGPTMVLEPVDGVITIGKPSGAAQQKWAIVSKEDGFFAIKPSHDSSLALSVEAAGVTRGTQIILEPDTGKPSQLWALTKQEGGAYTLTPNSTRPPQKQFPSSQSNQH